MTTNTTPSTRSTTSGATPAGLRLNNTFVFTEDVEASLSFYRDVLGLPVVTDVTNGDFRWLSLGVPSQPGLEITIQTVAAACPQRLDGTSDAGREALADLLAQGVLPPLIFTVDDVDVTFEHVLASGAEVIQEPADQFYGVRDCAFRDPSGTMVRFNSVLTEHS